MSDIIDEIDRLHAEATPGPWILSAGECFIDGKDDEVCDCSYDRDGRLIHAIVNNWPAIRDRLREAERRAKAFDLIASKVVYAVMCGDKWAAKQKGTSGLSSLDFDLLTAIEAANRCANSVETRAEFQS